ncbi:hypothetical protein PIB30_072999 [Stylosanthes scabra]|uniref:Uncharacterized protein n=1 Tax=Stylosanthes scabra TaxID=79078 RepID=A0ABU6QPM0_9FABA|nr:hypothetical protein [Stylosanthes scabra]
MILSPCCFQALLRRAVLLSLPELFYSATSILCCFSAATKPSHCWINVEGEFVDIIEGEPSFKNILQIKNGFSLRSSLKQGNEPRLDLDGDILDGKVSKRFGDVVVAFGSALEFPEDVVGVGSYDVVDGVGVEVDGGLGGGVAEHVGGPVKEVVAVVDKVRG